MRLLSIAPLLLLGFAASAQAADSAPVAVVELFTSEGCSSCPPADRVLADLARDARANGRRVYLLEFHVDYWNSLGWRDPFSDAAYSQRQREYATALAGEQVYTPQMIVNGTVEFVGSNRARADREIAAALARPARASVQLAIHGTLITYRVEGAPRGARLSVAVVDSAEVTRVTRGENARRTLAHAQVVRALESRALDGATTGTIDLHRGLAPGGQVIAFVQKGSTREVLGAAETH